MSQTFLSHVSPFPMTHRSQENDKSGCLNGDKAKQNKITPTLYSVIAYTYTLHVICNVCSNLI